MKESTTSLVSPIFARHETFHPRFGWLKKGFDLAKINSSIFQQDDAPVQLGVGKNMVNSIRYWCHAFKVLEEKTDSSGQGKSGYLSNFGEQLLADDGWDSFLEDPASLWLLHWNLLKPTCYAAAWYYTFNIFREVEFTDDDLQEGLTNYTKELKNSVADNSLKKDLTCILRMYVTQRNKKGPIEDSIDCPFSELGLIYLREDSRKFTFRIGHKPNLPSEIIVGACLEYVSISSPRATTISISRLLYDIGSPGMVFKLTESALCEAIERVAENNSLIFLSDSSGLIQFSFKEEPQTLSNTIIGQYYQQDRRTFQGVKEK